MTEFYLVRHGETEINQSGALNGGLVDSPLTAKGHDGALIVGHALSGIAFTEVLSSPMPRALTTAKLIMSENHAQAQTPLKPVNGLWEMRLGDWDGHVATALPDQEAVEIYFHRPAEFDADYAEAFHIERYAEVAKRSVPVLTTAAQAHPTGKILVVAHGLVFLVLLNALMGRPIARLREEPLLKNTTVTKLTTRDGKHFDLVYRDRAPEEVK